MTSPRLPADNALGVAICPKCGVRFSTRNRWGVVRCQADTPPFVGYDPETGKPRGCGWLLRVEPAPLGGMIVDAVEDLKVHPATGQAGPGLMSDAMMRVIEYWRRRGVKFVMGDNGRYEAHFPSYAVLDDEQSMGLR